MSVPETLTRETGEREVDGENARRTVPMGDLDPTRWQTLCCPHCGNRPKTVFVGLQ